MQFFLFALKNNLHHTQHKHKDGSVADLDLLKMVDHQPQTHSCEATLSLLTTLYIGGAFVSK